MFKRNPDRASRRKLARRGPPATGPRRSGWHWGTPVEAVAASLELTASEQPELLEFFADVLVNSTMRFAVRELATELDVPPEEIGQAFGRACRDLDVLERSRKAMWQPAELLEDPNLPALLHACKARMKRVAPAARRLRLERIRRRLQSAYGLLRTRVWIEAFIGPPAAQAEGSR